MEEPRYKVKTAPIFSVLELDQLKRNLRIGTQDEDDNSQDEYLQEILDNTIELVQTDIGRQLARATYTLYLDGFPDSKEMLITLGPVAAISSVKYYNSSNVLTTMAVSDYMLDNILLSARLKFVNIYSVYSDRLNGVEIEFTNGWATAAEIPKDIKDAIILLATERYLNPENAMLNFGMGVRQTAAERILRKYRVQRF
jgi:uncharacterized phiE125 gp8 family phage protein